MRQSTRKALCWKTQPAKYKISGKRENWRVGSDTFSAVLRKILAGIVPDGLSFDEFVTVDDEGLTESENFELSAVIEQENSEESSEGGKEMRRKRCCRRRPHERSRGWEINYSCICVRKAPTRMS